VLLKAYFGDNQFVGVNHTGGRGREYVDKYSSVESIATTLRQAWLVGIRDFSFTIMPRTTAAINEIYADCPFRLHPAVPYAHTVYELIAQKGLSGALREKLRSIGIYNLVRSLAYASGGHYTPLISSLIKAEISGLPVEGVKSIGLLNIATDFLLGSKRGDVLANFHGAAEGMGLKPTFYTMNPVLLVTALDENLLQGSRVVFNLNDSGFRVNPSMPEVLALLQKPSAQEYLIMSLFSGASGGVEEFLETVPNLHGVLFGSSNRKHIEESYRTISHSV
jgi:hypothetical protein